ncbi:site-specific tyrosine recombinase XerD [Campylobacterota bacterium]|nr:site-specific tyrosine recombinase XerD [Campylobacterota bacterium]
MSTIEPLPMLTHDSLRTLGERFLAFLYDNLGRREKTITVYRIVLNQAIPLIEFDREKNKIDFIRYRELIAKQKATTISKKVSALRSFTTYLEGLGYRFHTVSLNSVKKPKPLPKPVSHKQIMEALDTIGGTPALLVHILYGLGLRISEASDLEIALIGEHFARVTGKGNKMREVPIHSQLHAKITAFVASAKPTRWLFEENGEPLSPNQLRYMITSSFEKVGLKVTPHQLRHAFATEMLNSGAAITDVSEILGHSQLSTTQIYTKLSGSLMLKNYLSAHPLCKGN